MNSIVEDTKELRLVLLSKYTYTFEYPMEVGKLGVVILGPVGRIFWPGDR